MDRPNFTDRWTPKDFREPEIRPAEDDPWMSKPGSSGDNLGTADLRTSSPEPPTTHVDDSFTPNRVSDDDDADLHNGSEPIVPRFDADQATLLIEDAKKADRNVDSTSDGRQGRHVISESGPLAAGRDSQAKGPSSNTIPSWQDIQKESYSGFADGDAEASAAGEGDYANPTGTSEDSGPEAPNGWYEFDEFHDEFEITTRSLEEPDPKAIYDPELSEPLYVPEVRVPNFSERLRISEFVDSVDKVTEEQRAEIIEVLNTFSTTRRRNWVPWLKRQVWTGESLLLLLKFRIYHWEQEDNEHYWRRVVWSTYTRDFHFTTNHNNLTRQKTYILVNARNHCPAADIIDELWYEEWSQMALWRIGFYSFANYVLFRAVHEEIDDWSAKSSLLMELRTVGRPFLESKNEREMWQYLPRQSDTRSWFSQQDWYGASEWHDNLGWIP